MCNRLRWEGLGLCLCLAAVVVTGCAPDSGPSSTSDTEAAAVVPKDLPTAAMPSIEDATELAERVEATMAEGDARAFAEAMDWELLFDRSTAGVDTPDEMESGFRAGLLKGVTGGGGLPAQVAQAVQQGGGYRLLRVREKDGELRALFRFLLPEAGVNYHDLLLVQGDNGQVRIGDIHIFLSAEDLSTTFRRFYVVMVAEQNRSLLEKLSGKTAVYAEHLDEMQAMNTSIQSGQPATALATYDSLPDELKADKYVLLTRYRAAAEIGDAECSQAVRDFKQHHPDDACVDFLSIDLCATTGEFDKGLECIDRMEESVGGDPYLNVLRAGTLALANRLEEALEAGKAAIEAEPNMIQAYWKTLEVALQLKDFKEVTRLLDQLAANFEIEFEDLTQIPEYAEYVKSAEYQKWLESQQK
jgi:tetratricopeptide (TPR) repeat protein